MSQTEPQPNSGDDANIDFESLMYGVLPQAPGLEEQFRELDTKKGIEQRTAENEGKVIDYLQDKIPDVAALKKMLESLKSAGVDYPMCDHVTTILEEMHVGEYSNYPDDFLAEMMRMEKFAIIIEQFAGSEMRPVVLSADDVLTEIVQEELFTPEERDALADATQLFMETE